MPSFSLLFISTIQGQGYSVAATTRQQQQQQQQSVYTTASNRQITNFDPNLNSAATASNATTSPYINVILVPPPQQQQSQTSSNSNASGTSLSLTTRRTTTSSDADLQHHLDDQNSFIHLSPSDEARFFNTFTRQTNQRTTSGEAAPPPPPPSYEEHQVVAADLNQLSISQNEYQLVHQHQHHHHHHHHDQSNDYSQHQNDHLMFRNGRFMSLLEANANDNSVELVSEVQAMLNNYAASQNEIVEFNLEPMSVVFKEETTNSDFLTASQDATGGSGTGGGGGGGGAYSPVSHQYKGNEGSVLDSIGPVLDRDQERLLLENTMSPLCKYKIFLFFCFFSYKFSFLK